MTLKALGTITILGLLLSSGAIFADSFHNHTALKVTINGHEMKNKYYPWRPTRFCATVKYKTPVDNKLHSYSIRTSLLTGAQDGCNSTLSTKFSDGKITLENDFGCGLCTAAEATQSKN